MAPGPRKTSGSSFQRATFARLLYHLHPIKIPEAALDLKRTFGLGGMSLVLILLLALSGSMMLFVYKPFPREAYESVVLLQEAYVFGRFVRALHYFCANLLVITSAAHMLRVFFTQSFHGPRKSNWIIGLALLLAVLFSCFTGYLLPWDQTAYWAVTVCLSMFEYLPVPVSLETTLRTLQVFFTLHTTLIPIFFMVFLPLHFWKIRKARGIGLPEEDKGSYGRSPVPAVDNLVPRELTAGLLLIALVMVLAALFKAPLGGMANPGLSPNPAKAPWYFMGFQEMLLHFPPVVAVLAAPLALLILFLTIPYLNYPVTSPCPWFISGPGRITGGIAFFASLLLTLVMVVAGQGGTGPAWLVLVAGIPALTIWLKTQFRLRLNEVIQTLVIQIVTIYLTLALTGSIFRGEGMRLTGGPF
ncbi:MAG: cytochrome b N-terminal domain-containing protein [Desulfobacterales bacterium]|nr:cytochrome b N-terminal domain-containing protein [Desulfobacterales bacterium]